MIKKILFMLLSGFVFFSVSAPERVHADFTASAAQENMAGPLPLAAGTYVSVVDYGAVADGNGENSGTDNLGAFQNAIAAAVAQRKDLYIPGGSGYYRIFGGLKINVDYDRGITLFGDGKDVSRIHIDTNEGVHGLEITGPAGRAPINVKNLAIKKTKKVFDEFKLVLVMKARDFVCSNLDVSGSTGMSLVVSNSVNGLIENNYVHDTAVLADGCDGIHVDDGEGNSANIEIRNNVVNKTGDDGISVGCHFNGTVQNASVHHNNIQNTRGSGIKIHEGAQDIDVYANTILDTNLGGIGVEAVHFGTQNIQNIRIYNNNIRRPCRCDCGYWGGIAVVDRETHPSQISGFEIHDNYIKNFNNRWGILIGELDNGGNCVNPVRHGYIWNNTIIDKVTPPRRDKLIGIICAEDISLQPPPPPPPPPPTTMTVNLQASNGQYVVAEEGGGGVVNANRDWAGPWETFLLTDLNGSDVRHGDQVTFRCYNPAYYLQAVGGGCADCALMAWGGGPGPWETFVIIDIDHPGDAIHSGDRVALRTWYGYYVVAELGGGDVVNANRSAVGPWEIFTLYIW